MHIYSLFDNLLIKVLILHFDKENQSKTTGLQ